MRGPLLLLSGRANPSLSTEIGELIGMSPDGATIKEFEDGEIFVRIEHNVRGRDVFILQPTSAPADNIMELCLLIDAAKRASAASVTAVASALITQSWNQAPRPVGTTKYTLNATAPRPAAHAARAPSSSRLPRVTVVWTMKSS